MRLRWMGLTLAVVALASAWLAWGCNNEARPPGGEPRAAGPDYTNFAPPPLVMPTPGGNGAAPTDTRAGATATIVRAAGAFRVAAAADVAGALRELPAGSCLSFIATTDAFQAMPDAWAYFFSTTVMLVGNQGTPEPVVAYYSPFLDAAVLTRWRIDAQGLPAMTGATFRSGAELESRQLASAAALPRWMCNEAPGPLLLGKHYRTFLTSFGQQFPPAPATAWDTYVPASPAALQGMGAMATMQALAMCALYDGPNKGLCDSLRQLREAVARADAGGLGRIIPQGNVLPVSEITGLPAPFRSHMAPVFAVWSERQVLVFLGDSAGLRFYSVAAYDVDNTVRLKGFNLFDLMETGPEAAVAQTGGAAQP